MKYGATLTADYFNISGSELSIEKSALLSCSAQHRLGSDSIDLSPGAGQSGSGASHGGVGGDNPAGGESGAPYGSLYLPRRRGTRGGGAGRAGGRGGGYIHLTVGAVLINDGTISADGEGSSGGGGSGGSILIKASVVEGIGKYSLNGGDGVGSGGGAGAGGRMAVHAAQRILHEGTYESRGGDSPRPSGRGGGGTVYLEDVRGYQPYRRLLVDNANRPWEQYTDVSDVGVTHYVFDELHISRQATLRFRPTPGARISLLVRRVVGDGTGLLHVQEGQYAALEYEQSKIKAFTAGINVMVDEGAEVHFPATLYVYGRGARLRTFTEPRSIHLFGQLTGVSHLLVTEAKTLYFGPRAHTALWENGTYVFVEGEGEFSMGRLELKSHALFLFHPDTPLLCNAGRIDVRYLAVMSAENIIIMTGTLNVEAGGRITVAAHDRTRDTLDSTAGRGGAGTGAGHASRGGYRGGVEGGASYGDMYRPVERGSRGGATGGVDGGAGGGVIRLVIGFVLYVDGDITVDGAAKGSGAGGSGGSLWATAWALRGHGLLSARGGAGEASGSGGRIAVHLGTRNHYSGRYTATGGGGDAGGLAAGGAGSVFLRDTRYTLPHSTLLLDNGGSTWDQAYTLTAPHTAHFAFDELHLFANASLRLSPVARNASITVTKLVGDRSGRIHLLAGHTGFIERATTARTTTKTPANIWVDAGATVYMATTVYVLGSGRVALRWHGEIVGVQHLRVVAGRRVEMGAEARTSTLLDGVYHPGLPGVFEMASFELGAYSFMPFPTPMGMHFTFDLLVSIP